MRRFSGIVCLICAAGPLLAADGRPVARLERHGAEFSVAREQGTGLPVEVVPRMLNPETGTPQQAAMRFISRHAGWLGWAGRPEMLQEKRVSVSPAGSHVFFKVEQNGREVVNAYANVHLDRWNQVVLLHQQPPAEEPAWPEDFPPMATCVEVSSRDFISNRGYTKPWKPLAVSGGMEELLPDFESARQVYFLEEGSLLAAWEVVLRSARPAARVTYWAGGNPVRILGLRSDVKYVTGSGKTFQPNPVIHLNDRTLTVDSPPSVFEPAYVDAPLLLLAAQLNGMYYLTGSWVQIADLAAGTPRVEVPAESTPVFNYDRYHPGFTAVQAYYWITSSQLYLQSLGFDNLVHYMIRVDVHGMDGADNSQYIPAGYGGPYLEFGDGGVPDAEDADIILHEYGHAIQDSANPDALGWSGENLAMQEGFSDYWSFSRTYDLCLARGADPYSFGDWDARGINPPANGWRRLDTGKMYPLDMRLDDHINGEIWSCALKNLFLRFGREVTDRLVLQSFYYMPAALVNKFYQSARALVTADQNLYQGRHIFEICQEFYRCGIFSAADCQTLAPYFETPGPVLTQLEGNGNGIPEPGEVFQVDIPVNNSGKTDAGVVTGRLAGTAGLTVYEPIAMYGPAPANSGILQPRQSFVIKISETANCGDWLQWNLSLSFDGHRQEIPYVFQAGAFVDTAILTDNLETPSTLWQKSTATGFTDVWSNKTGAYFHAGSKIWFAAGVNRVNDSSLLLGPLNLSAGFWYTFSFWQTYKQDSGYDGLVLEISTDGLQWQDAGPWIYQNGYRRQIESRTSPVSGRNAWTGGKLESMKQVLVNLQPWAGQTIQLRFRAAADQSVTSSGWYIDDVALIQRVLTCTSHPFGAGDLTGDGLCNATDQLLMAQLLADNISPGQGSFLRGLWAADLDENGLCEVLDLQKLLYSQVN